MMSGIKPANVNQKVHYISYGSGGVQVAIHLSPGEVLIVIIINLICSFGQGASLL